MRERCKYCGAFMGFDMGQEGDGDFVCNNKKCKSNLNDWRANYEEVKYTAFFGFRNDFMRRSQIGDLPEHTILVTSIRDIVGRYFKDIIFGHEYYHIEDVDTLISFVKDRIKHE